MLPSSAVDTDSNPLADPEAFYNLHIPGLVDYAVNELHVPRAEAEELATKVLLASVRHTPRPNLSEFLKGAMLYAVQNRRATNE